MGEDNYFDFGNEPTKTTKKETKVAKDKTGEKKTSGKNKPPSEPKGTDETKVTGNKILEEKINALELKMQLLESKEMKEEPNTFDLKIKELDSEQQKLNTQMQLLSSFENVFKNLKPNNSLIYYNTESVVRYIKKTLGLELDDSELNSKKKIELLPDWNTYTSDQKDMLNILVRCIREGKTFEKFNKIQSDMNEQKTI